MKEIIEQILPLWGIENRQILQIHPSTWEINQSYVIKLYSDIKQLEKNIKLSEILLDCAIPVAKTFRTITGEKYVESQNRYFLMSKKLQGRIISDRKDKTTAWKMGCAIARLHRAFMKCETEVEFEEDSLLKEMKGWVRETLINHEWKILNEDEYSKTVECIESVYDCLPKQLIHRDVHFGNFLFFEGDFSGYIDFDLSQKNIRIFDVCYFLTGLLSAEPDDPFTQTEWIENTKSVIAGYESILHLSEKEKIAIPSVMECIEILFIAYFINMNDTKRANSAYHVFCFIRNCEKDIKNVI